VPASASAARYAATVSGRAGRAATLRPAPCHESGEIGLVGTAPAFRLVLFGILDGPGNVGRQQCGQRRGRLQDDGPIRGVCSTCPARIFLIAFKCDGSMIDGRKKSSKPKQGRGRPLGSRTTFIGKAIGLRLYPDLEAKIDEWIERQETPRPSKPEAIRQLLERALAAQPNTAKPRRPVKKTEP
jgi:hypothetical protein